MLRLSRRTFLASAVGALSGGLRPPLARSEDKIDTTKLVAGNTAFGCELYGRLREQPGNLFLSPFSVSTALGMTAAGARGKTLEEMEAVLHLPPDAPAAFGEVSKSLNAEPDAQKRGFTLSAANSLWAQTGYPWRDEYKTRVAKGFGAGLFDADYATNPDAARAAINSWVEKETREKIKDLLKKQHVSDKTRLVLVNAIYFKGDWQDPFKKEHTKELPFTLADGKTVDAPLMHRAGRYSYAEGDGYQALDLPYTTGRVSMTVILPTQPDGLPAVEKRLTGDKLAAVLKELRPEPKVYVHLPRFKLTWEFELSGPLSALGMKTVFDRDADFGGMAAGERFHLSAVVHKAFVEVTEEGTEAAAATAVTALKLLSLKPPKPREPKYFRADRPFLFLIRDTTTGSVLFLGRVNDPTK